MKPLSDKEWRARDDFRTLAEAEKIKRSKKRMQEAKAAGKKELDEKQEEINAMKKITGGKSKTVKVKNNKTGKTVTIKKGAKPPKTYKKKGKK